MTVEGKMGGEGRGDAAGHGKGKERSAESGVGKKGEASYLIMGL